MKTGIRLVSCLFATLILSGCSSTVPVSLDRSTPRGDTLSVAALNRRIKDSSINIFVDDGRVLQARNLNVTEDSCFFPMQDSVARQALGLDRVIRFERKDHIAGGVCGFLLGGAGGLLVTVTAASLNHSHGDFSGLGVALAGLCVTAAGSIAGLVVGALNGNSYNYQILARDGKAQSEATDSSAPGNGAPLSPDESRPKE